MDNITPLLLDAFTKVIGTFSRNWYLLVISVLVSAALKLYVFLAILVHLVLPAVGPVTRWGTFAAGLVVGALLTVPADAGILLALATAAALVVTAVVTRDLGGKASTAEVGQAIASLI